jgi:3-dehydroquinate dehydratase
MAGTCMSFAKLDQEKYDKVRKLEEELGTHIIAVEQKCHWSNIDQNILDRLQEAEEEMGVILLAYEQE